jgi:hypothetical protein
MSSKIVKIITVILLSALTIGTISVTGLLQSTERIGASGIIIRPVESPILPPSTPVTPPPPEPQIDIEIYSNSACTQLMSTVDWGEIEAGGSSSTILYVKNNGDTVVVLSLDSENWSSTLAMNNMYLTWNYDGSSMQPGQVKAVTITLIVEADCPELSNFGFDIVIIGS